MARYVKSGTVNTIQEINSELEKIATAQDEFLTRNGEAPNEMKATLDMNSNRITNLKAPVSGTDAARLVDVTGEYDITVGIDETPVFDNIAEMTSTNLTVGQLARCKRYYSSGELVEGLVYEIQATATVDGFVDHSNSNGTISRLLRSDSINATQGGVLSGGVFDNTVVLNAIMPLVREIKFTTGTYLIAGNLSIPSNTTFVGLGQAEFLGVMTSEGGGGYPNQMLTNSDFVGGNQNIHFENIKFNFAKGAFNYSIGVGLTTINSIYFENTDNITFSNCEFFDFVTNLDSTLSGKGILAFGAGQFVSCDRVSFDNVKSRNLREEGFAFYKCSQVSFNKWDADGTAVNTSSHAGFWYCDGVSVTNSKFVHTGGSVLNCCSRNVTYKNNTVNENTTQDGRGFDFGNEIDEEFFEIGNINVEGNTLNVSDYGIFIQPALEASFNDIVDAINIENNRILVSTGSAGVCFGIRTLSSKALKIENNIISLSDSASGLGQCIIMSLLSTTEINNESTNIQIQNNYMKGLTGISITNNVNSSINGLNIVDNTFISQDKGALPSFSGSSVFFYIRNNTTAVDDFNVNNIRIQNNQCYNLGGGLIVTSLDAPTKISIANLDIIENKAYGDSVGMDRAVSIDCGSLASDLKQVNFSNNTINNGSTITIIRCEKLIMDRNTGSWDTTYTGRRISLSAFNGTCDVTNNRFYNVSSSQNDINETAGTYEIVNVTGNCSINNVGTLVWGSNLPANTVLPN
jgi:hypothetical protein